MTDAAQQSEQQLRLAKLQARRGASPSAKAITRAASPDVSPEIPERTPGPARRSNTRRAHPARVARIAVLGLSATTMFGLVAKMSADSVADQVTTANAATEGGTTAAVPATVTPNPAVTGLAEAAIEAELTNATLVTLPPVQVNVVPTDGAPVQVASGSTGAAQATPIAVAPEPAPAPVRTNGSN